MTKRDKIVFLLNIGCTNLLFCLTLIIFLNETKKHYKGIL